ncbi:MAG: serine/threonine-protein kinase, partial [Nannocystaceae bacterium]|nr:serine/threonine-protein kinase [Nannocystaceae bacterium]
MTQDHDAHDVDSEHDLAGALGVGAATPPATSTFDAGRVLARAAARRALFPELVEAQDPIAIGRYRIRELLGRGGMGVVYAADDPELHRRVAIKVLGSGDGDDDARARLVREAQALARVAHPNVVAVHDAGTVPALSALGGRAGETWVFVAMELVEGATLRQWLLAAQHSWREILATLVAAGRGLAAVHAAGLVHRDVKPDNVMIGRDGRTRVMDFGLARGPEMDATEPSVGHRDALSLSVTRTGAIVGTPAYMAPEQHLGLPLDAKSDQFGFCVMAWEALHGVRPFRGRTVEELAAAVCDGRLAPLPETSRVPQWLRHALRRGLATDPSQRFASMDALLEALQRDPGRRRIAQVLTAGVTIALLAGAAAQAWSHRRTASTCAAAAAEIDRVWNDDARARVREAFDATAAPHARATFERVVPWLDRERDAWTELRERACLAEAASPRSEQGPRQRACLHDRLAGFTATIDELTRADRALLDQAVTMAAGLQPVAQCEQERELLRYDTPAATQGEDAEAVRAELARARTAVAAARFDEAWVHAQAASAAGAALDDPRLRAECELMGGAIEQAQGHFDRAAPLLLSAYHRAGAAGADELAAATATRMVRVSEGLGQLDRAEAWADDARMWLERAGELGGVRESDLLAAVASVQNERGRYADALATAEAALALTRTAEGEHHPDVAISTATVGAQAGMAGDATRARVELERALALGEPLLGEHPDVAIWIANLGMLAEERGALDEALSLHRRALQILEHTAGPDSPTVAGVEDNIGRVHYLLDQLDEAERHHRRALAIRERIGNDGDLAYSYNNLATLALKRSEPGRAVEALRAAVAAMERSSPGDHPVTATLLGGLALALGRDQKYDEAVSTVERAIAMAERTHADAGAVAHLRDLAGTVLVDAGKPRDAIERYRAAMAQRAAAQGDPDDDLDAWQGLARAHLALAEPDAAADAAERALAILARRQVAPAQRASLELLLARASWDAGRDRTRA